MKCVNCLNLDDCGKVKYYLKNYSKTSLLKELNRSMENGECKDFESRPIVGEILKHKLEELTKLSNELKASLKQAKNKK